MAGGNKFFRLAARGDPSGSDNFLQAFHWHRVESRQTSRGTSLNPLSRSQRSYRLRKLPQQRADHSRRAVQFLQTKRFRLESTPTEKILPPAFRIPPCWAAHSHPSGQSASGILL